MDSKELKDTATISSLKQEIRSLKKQKTELLGAAKDRRAIEKVRKKIKLYKRMTRKLSREAKAAAPAAGQSSPA
jgi:hypothetical protein